MTLYSLHVFALIFAWLLVRIGIPRHQVRDLLTDRSIHYRIPVLNTGLRRNPVLVLKPRVALYTVIGLGEMRLLK